MLRQENQTLFCTNIDGHEFEVKANIREKFTAVINQFYKSPCNHSNFDTCQTELRTLVKWDIEINLKETFTENLIFYFNLQLLNQFYFSSSLESLHFLLLQFKEKPQHYAIYLADLANITEDIEDKLMLSQEQINFSIECYNNLLVLLREEPKANSILLQRIFKASKDPLYDTIREIKKRLTSLQSFVKEKSSNESLGKQILNFLKGKHNKTIPQSSSEVELSEAYKITKNNNTIK